MSVRLYLTGFMGCGKSTVGVRVADHLGFRFVDLDSVIEGVTGRQVQTLFAEGGEAAFRKIEAQQLRWTAELSNAVVSVGGGALVVPENMDFALANGHVVYLRAEAEMLALRLARSRVVRPLLLDADGNRLPQDALLERVATMLAAREHQYLRAHTVVDITEQPVAATVQDVLAALPDAIRPQPQARSGQ